MKAAFDTVWQRFAWEKLIFAGVIAIIVWVVLVPLAMLVFGALVDAPPGTPSSFTMDNFRRVANNPYTYSSLWNTFVYAFGASLVGFTIGTFAAWVTERTNTPLRSLIFLGTVFPMFIPTVLMAVAWTSLLSPKTGLINQLLMSWLGLSAAPFNVYSLGGMIFVAGIMEAPLAFLWMWPAFKAMDPALEEAAFASGAGLGRTFWTVTLPLTTPAFLASWLILFVQSLEALAVPLFIGIPGKIIVFSTEIFLATARSPRDLNLASAYAILLLCTSLFGVHLYRKATQRTERFATVTGRGYRAHRLDLGPWRFLTCAISLLLLLLTAVLPLLTLAWNSLMPYMQGFSVDGLSLLTLEHYRRVVDLSMARRALINSVYIGLASGMGIMALTTIAAWIVVRSRLPGRGLLDFLSMVPMAVPGIVVGLSMIWVYLTLPIPIYGTPWILLVAYLSRFLPYGIRIAYAAFSQVHRELEEAASACGSSWGRTMRQVTAPLLTPGLAAGIVYIMLRAFRELPASIMLSNYGSEVFSVAVYDLWNSGEVGQLSAYALITILILSAVVALVYRTAVRFGIRP